MYSYKYKWRNGAIGKGRTSRTMVSVPNWAMDKINEVKLVEESPYKFILKLIDYWNGEYDNNNYKKMKKLELETLAKN